MKQEKNKIQNALNKYGMLIIADNELPSFTTLVCGEAIKGSWWGHPKGNLIYNLLNEFYDREDLLAVKLLNKKLTLVQQNHWNALNTIANSKSTWQLQRLKPEEVKLFKNVLAKGEIQTDSLKTLTATEAGKLASKLEERLLIYSESVHTDSGKHVRVLYSWAQIFKKRKFRPTKMKLDDAVVHFTELLALQTTNSATKYLSF